MTIGTFYGVSVGPGDPGLITVKAREVLSHCRHVFVPESSKPGFSIPLLIARRYLPAGADVVGLDCRAQHAENADRHWEAIAGQIALVLRLGQDACFLGHGDMLLYSTYAALLRPLVRMVPGLEVVTVPGVTGLGAAAALANFPIGNATEPVTIVSTPDAEDQIRAAFRLGGTVVLQGVGKRLELVLDLLEEHGLVQHGLFVDRAGLPGERVVKDLTSLRENLPRASGLSTIFVQVGRSNPSR